jgi:hypothetical protein
MHGYMDVTKYLEAMPIIIQMEISKGWEKME